MKDSIKDFSDLESLKRPVSGQKPVSIHTLEDGTIFVCKRQPGYCANKRPSDKIQYPGLCFLECPAFQLIKKGTNYASQ